MTWMRRVLMGLLCLGMALGLAACGGTAAAGEGTEASGDDGPQAGAIQDAPAADSPADTASAQLSPAEQKLSELTLEEKVAQLFMVTLETLEDPAGAAAAAVSAQEDPESAEGVPAVTQMSVDIQQNLQKYPVGGVILFAQNIVTPEQTSQLTASLQEASGSTTDRIPLFIAVDEEGGAVARLAQNESFNLPQYESAEAVGSGGDADDVLAMGQTIGGYLSDYGFNVDFAPVADVATNPDNTVIGSRSFSSDPATAAAMASAFAQGLRENGVTATFKHFPGHGDTAQDSHSELATTDKSLEELSACEFLPFDQATNEDFVMVGHIAAPTVTGDFTPATLSEKLISDELRDHLGFDGVVVTDALNMGAIVNTYGAGDVAVKALQAGCDLLLMPQDFEMAYDAVLAAVRDGALTEERIDESVLRILTAKYRTEETETGNSDASPLTAPATDATTPSETTD